MGTRDCLPWSYLCYQKEATWLLWFLSNAITSNASINANVTYSVVSVVFTVVQIMVTADRRHLGPQGCDLALLCLLNPQLRLSNPLLAHNCSCPLGACLTQFTAPPSHTPCLATECRDCTMLPGRSNCTLHLNSHFARLDKQHHKPRANSPTARPMAYKRCKLLLS